LDAFRHPFSHDVGQLIVRLTDVRLGGLQMLNFGKRGTKICK